jgi:hypothetical protein
MTPDQELVREGVDPPPPRLLWRGGSPGRRGARAHGPGL